MICTSFQLISNIAGRFIICPSLVVISIILPDFIMCSYTRNRVFFDNGHSITHFQGPQPVSDNDYRLAFAQVFNSLINLHLIFGVCGTCSLV